MAPCQDLILADSRFEDTGNECNPMSNPGLRIPGQYLERAMANALGHKTLLLAWYADHVIPPAGNPRHHEISNGW